MDISSAPKTWWGDSKYASSNHGSKILKELFVDNPFDFPKSVALVEDCIRASGGGKEGMQIVDFFAGSGTTGHAVINLNREDDGQRKYVLVEIGDHFDTVLLSRMKKGRLFTGLEGWQACFAQEGWQACFVQRCYAVIQVHPAGILRRYDGQP